MRREIGGNMFTGMKIYIAGPITGTDDFKERFAAAEKYLIDQDAKPMNPAALPAGYTWGEYMHICFSMIDVCDAVYFLDNWKDSQGALREFEYASAHGKQLLYENLDPAWKLDNAVIA
jgi:hypothetical protein